jgi:hypothetical protein
VEVVALLPLLLFNDSSSANDEYICLLFARGMHVVGKKKEVTFAIVADRKQRKRAKERLSR